MTLIINSTPGVDQTSVGMTLAQRLAEKFGRPLAMIRIYDENQGYFNYEYRQDWIDLFIRAERLIFPVPIWNFSVPAALKDFFDKIVKRGQVWDLDLNNKFIGLLKDRPAFIILTSGDEYPPNSPYDFVVPYLRTLLSSIGISDVREFRIGNVSDSRTLAQNKAYMDQKTKAMFEAFRIY